MEAAAKFVSSLKGEALSATPRCNGSKLTSTDSLRLTQESQQFFGRCGFGNNFEMVTAFESIIEEFR